MWYLGDKRGLESLRMTCRDFDHYLRELKSMFAVVCGCWSQRWEANGYDASIKLG